MAGWSCTPPLEQQRQNSELELEEGWVPSICWCTSLLLTGSNPPAQYHAGWSKQSGKPACASLYVGIKLTLPFPDGRASAYYHQQDSR